MQKKIILHRGYKGKYPENSEISFYHAINENLPFETDIRVSKDGTLFLIHDDNLERLFSCNGKIKDLDSEMLKKLTYKEDSNQKLFSFIELCNLVIKMNYHNLIFIHIKELEDLEAVINILESYNYNFKEKYNFKKYNFIIVLFNILKKLKNNYYD